MPLPPEARLLTVSGADRAVLDEPAGRLLVSRGHNDAHGTPAELRRFARAILAACDQAAVAVEPSGAPIAGNAS